MLSIILKDISGWKIKKNSIKSGSIEGKSPKRVLSHLTKRKAKRRARKVQGIIDSLVELAL